MNVIDILLISDKYDFTTDFICIELERRNANYLRLNRDEFHLYKIQINSNTFDIVVSMGDAKYVISQNDIKSIYFRAPIFLRDIYPSKNNVEDTLYREQWMAFVRNLLIFENVVWINNPEKTYKAENKMVQLKYAKKVGFKIPETFVTNFPPVLEKQKYVVKSLDTAFFHIEGKEGFVYSNIFHKDTLRRADLQYAPIIIQDYIYPKTDIRVTVIGNDVFATKITSNGKGVDIDWRKVKDNVEFSTIRLPIDIKNKSVEIVKQLGLTFGAIDLLQTAEQEFVFLEINPTGEWAWLVHSTGQPIPQSITQVLMKA